MLNKNERKAQYVLPASTVASLITTILVNPLDVIKIKQ